MSWGGLEKTQTYWDMLNNLSTDERDKFLIEKRQLERSINQYIKNPDGSERSVHKYDSQNFLKKD
jgi:hypothetical protein